MYKNELLAVANNILNHKYDALDIVHEAFVKFFVQMNDSVDIRCNKTRGLIFIIVRHLAINLYNQRKCRYMIDIDKIDAVAADDLTPELKLINLDNNVELVRMLDNMKIEYAEILALKYIHGYTIAEIAKILNIKNKNASVRLHRAKKSFVRLI